MPLSFDFLLVLAGWLVALRCAAGLGRAPVAGLCLCWVFSQYMNNCGFFPLLWSDYDPEATWRSPVFLSYRVTREGTLAGQWSTLLSVAFFLIGAGTLVRWSGGPEGSARVPESSQSDGWSGLRSRILVAFFSALLYSRVPFDLPLKGASVLVLRSLLIAGAVIEQQRSNGVLCRSWKDYGLRLLAFFFALQSAFAGGFASYAFLLLGPLLILWVVKRLGQTSGEWRLIARVAILMVMLPLAGSIWMGARGAIRATVWRQDGGLVDGVAAAAEVDLISVADVDSDANEGLLVRFNHAHWLDRVEVNHRLNPELRGVDSKLPYMAISWLPRFLWPGKPRRTSGGSFLGLHADHLFGESTFGYGVIVDAFVYSGWLGVAVLLGALGGLMGFLGRVIMRAALRQDWAAQWVAWAAIAPWFDPLVDFFDGSSGAIVSLMVALAAVRIRR